MKTLLIIPAFAHASAPRLIAAAQHLNQTWDMLLLGADEQLAIELGQFGGEHVMWTSAASASSRQIATLATGYQYVLSASDRAGIDLLAQLSAILKMPMISQVCAIPDAETVRHYSHAGALLNTSHTTASIRLYAIRACAFEPAVSRQAATRIEKVEFAQAHPRQQRLACTRHNTLNLENANVVIGGGKGLGEQFGEVLTPLAELLQAPIGATRSAVEAGWISHDMQIGQTGKQIAPALYLAIGISGAAQHLSGIQDSKTVIAINSDPEAPIFKAANYGLVDDALSVVPELVQKLRAQLSH